MLTLESLMIEENNALFFRVSEGQQYSLLEIVHILSTAVFYTRELFI